MNEETQAFDERTILKNRFIGVALIFAGLYGMYMAYKIYKK